MLRYILNRLLLIIPTLFGILLLNFAVIQAAPGGPVEKLGGELKGMSTSTGAGFGGASADLASTGNTSGYRGSQGLPPELIERIEKLYGFDKPAHERFWLMVKNYATFDFGESYYKDKSVIDLIVERMPVSISLGLWSTLISYLVSIPLGIRKAV